MKPLVFVAEDSRFFLSVVRWGVVEKLGFEMVQATSLKETKEVLARHGTDIFVALLDLNLPDAPHGEVIDAVAALGIPTIVFTGSFTDEIREFILSKGVVDYITKDTPNGIESVIDLLRRLGRNKETGVLVVDDSRVTRGHLRRLLSLHGFKVVEASDGPQALAALEADPSIALAITDFNMPGMNGCELTRRMRAKRGRDDFAIIGLSAYGNPTISANFMKSGANDYMNKPFVPEEFFCRVYQNLAHIERIHQLRESEAAMKTLMTQAQAANEAKTMFLSTMSHELRTPLNAIIGFSQILMANPREKLSPTQTQQVGRVLDAGEHLLELINDALDIARVEAGRADLHDDTVDLVELCQRVAEMVDTQAQKRGVVVAVARPEDGRRVRADERRLLQVVLNLASNAVKFTPAKGSVTLSGGIAEDGRAYVEVLDTGVGMSAEELAVAMEPFGQVGERREREQGTGLGLPLAKALIEAHGGALSITTAPGQGTRATIHLPKDRLVG